VKREPDYATGDFDRHERVDRFFAEQLAPDDAALSEVLEANAQAGLPPHDVSALQGQMLAVLPQGTGATRVLELGTLGGYSTIRMARALPPGGMVVTIEADPARAAVARANIGHAEMADRVDLRVGRAAEVLPTLSPPFDFIFIDADKPSNPLYLRHALTLSRPGTLIVADNVVRGGGVADPDDDDPNVRGVRAFLDIVAAEPRLVATAIQTVGEKGWDGFILARVVSS